MGLLIIFSYTTNNIQSSYATTTTTTTTGTLPGFNFAAAGDWACTSDTTDTVNNIIDKSPELVLGLGDYSYEDSADCWLDIIQPIDNIMKIAIGNHEIEEESIRSEEHTSELQSRQYLVCRLLLAKKTHPRCSSTSQLHWACAGSQ